MWLYLALGVGAVLVLVIGLAQFNLWGSRPVVYSVGAPAEVEPFVRSWGQWLEDRGRIVVTHRPTGAEAEFRKRRFRHRPDELHFRFRNADRSRAYFAQVRAALDASGIAHDLELTPKQRRPRAIAVALDPGDVFTPVAAVRLLEVAFGAVAETTHVEAIHLEVFCEGRIRTRADGPDVELISTSAAHRLGVRLGSAAGRAASRRAGSEGG